MKGKGQRILKSVTRIEKRFQGGEGVWIGEVYCPIRGHERYHEKRVQKYVGRQQE